ALCVLLARPATAQFGYFGQNKIQYRGFDWHVLRGEHVDLYYYPEEQELARVALTYAEESYGALERRFNHHPHRRIPLIIYASHSDFEQTNVLPFVPPEGLLGVTEFLKQRVALPFTGSYFDFRHTLRHELVHVFQLSLTNQAFARYPRVRHVDPPRWRPSRCRSRLACSPSWRSSRRCTARPSGPTAHAACCTSRRPPGTPISTRSHSPAAGRAPSSKASAARSSNRFTSSSRGSA